MRLRRKMRKKKFSQDLHQFKRVAKAEQIENSFDSEGRLHAGNGEIFITTNSSLIAFKIELVRGEKIEFSHATFPVFRSNFHFQRGQKDAELCYMRCGCVCARTKILSPLSRHDNFPVFHRKIHWNIINFQSHLLSKSVEWTNVNFEPFLFVISKRVDLKFRQLFTFFARLFQKV